MIKNFINRIQSSFLLKYSIMVLGLIMVVNAVQLAVAWLVFGAAALLGVSVGLWAAQAIATLAIALFGFRRDRLLVECWDALHNSDPDPHMD